MRVILSMTTVPDRLGTYDETFDSIEAQTRKPDLLFIAGEKLIGDWLQHDVNGVCDQLPEAGIEVQLKTVEDRGPVTKLAVLEESWLRDDDLIVTIDDDIVYEPRWLETLVAGAEAYPNEAVGFAGWDASDFIAKAPNGGSYVWTSPGPCDVLEGWAGVAYRRKFFYIDPVMGFASVLYPLPMFKLVDDVWISWHLHRRGVGRRLVGSRMSQERAEALPGLHHREDFVDLNRKASIVAFGKGIP